MRNVRAILGGMPGFETAAVRAVLSDGPTNASYRVERNGMDLVLRVDKPAAAELGLDRSAERQVLQALAVAGLAEAPLFSDTAGGIMLRRFVPGRTWTREDITRPDALARLAQDLAGGLVVTGQGIQLAPDICQSRFQVRRLIFQHLKDFLGFLQGNKGFVALGND